MNAPKVTSVEVVATQPVEADRGPIAHLAASKAGAAPAEDVAYVVKIAFEEMPPITSQGWALYVKDERIPKYWEYTGGIYFKVFDPKFLADHEGDPLRFSIDGQTFVDTGKKLTSKKANTGAGAAPAAKLPLQADVLK